LRGFVLCRTANDPAHGGIDKFEIGQTLAEDIYAGGVELQSSGSPVRARPGFDIPQTTTASRQIIADINFAVAARRLCN
jgi:hypothetical protein